MGTRRFFLYSLIYVVAVGLLVYSLNQTSYTLDLIKFKLTLPVAVWVILPVAVLMFFMLLHLAYYGVKVFMQNRALNSDYKNFQVQAKMNLLGENESRAIKTKWLKLPSEILRTFNVWGSLEVDHIDDEEIRAVGKIVAQIKSGKYVDLKKYRLKTDNPLVIQNELNRLKVEPKSASEILKVYTNTSEGLGKTAYETMINNASYNEIKRFPFKLGSEAVVRIFERFADEKDDLYLDTKEIETLLNETKMSKVEYLKSAKILKNKLNPDVLMSLFETIYQANPECIEGYMYVLYELQMIDKLREILDSTDEKEYENFRILLFLRDNSKVVDSNLLV